MDKIVNLHIKNFLSIIFYQATKEKNSLGNIYKCPPMLCYTCKLHPDVLKLALVSPNI